MQEDEVRVPQLFALAKEAGIEVCKRSLRLEELRDVCSSPENLVLILVDKRVLQQGFPPSGAGAGGRHGALAKPAKAASLLCCGMLGGLNKSGYVGHYVVLHDYDKTTREFWVKDPASYNSVTIVAESVLEKARKSFGTDEDVIIVPYSK